MHLDEHDVARYVEGQLTDAERQRIEEHLANCTECRETVGAVRRLQDSASARESPELDPEIRRKAEGLASEPPPAQIRLETVLSPPVLAIAGLLLVAGVVGVLLWQGEARDTPRLRSSRPEAAYSVRAPADEAVVQEPPVFLCTAHPEALAYRVTLYAENGLVVWRGDTTAVRVPLPSDVSLSEGERYLWRAEALLSDGTMLRSDLHTFTYAP